MVPILATLLNRWLPVLIWAGVIYTLSSLSTLPTPEVIWWDYILKKSAHIFEYALLYFLLVRALADKSPLTYRTAFIIALLYAVSDELHQSFTPGRFPKPTDVGYDTFGMFVAYLRIKHFI